MYLDSLSDSSGLSIYLNDFYRWVIILIFGNQSIDQIAGAPLAGVRGVFLARNFERNLTKSASHTKVNPVVQVDF